ncbi:MAG TPA: hypothetical protein VET65_08200 [Candidatus Limnocylindrales bacterium]|nr:hypothetical protein [Candidatus Limnocylindrales bacterium]
MPVDTTAEVRHGGGEMRAQITPDRFGRLLGRRPWLTGAILVALTPVAGLYVFLSFTHPDPGARILLRALPILPMAVWTLWFDAARPWRSAPLGLRIGARLLALLGIMTIAVGLLGLGLNWIYDPSRIL